VLTVLIAPNGLVLGAMNVIGRLVARAKGGRN
jgi:branched-chain amino acid transport system permease protein